MTRSLSAIAALTAAAALAIAGCGGSSGSGKSTAYGPGEGAGATRAASGESGGYGGVQSTASGSDAGRISVASVGGIGEVLVDSKGLTLYLFEKDKGGKSTCYGACARAWPPLTTSGTPHAIGGAESSKLGTTKRKDGTIQVTYAGRPLYTYAADTKPGEDNGTGVDSFGAVWRPLHPDGEKAGE